MPPPKPRPKKRGAARPPRRTPTYRQPQQERALSTVDALLTATKELLVAEGVEAVTTNAVAKRAGVSIGSLYQYFPNRDALLAELSRRHVTRALELIFAEMQAVLDASIQVGARRLISLIWEVHRQDPSVHRALEASHPGLAARAQLARMESQVVQAARAYLQRHREELVVTDLDRAAFVVVTTIEALIHGAALKKPELFHSDVLIDDITRLVLGYLTGQAASPAEGTAPSQRD